MSVALTTSSYAPGPLLPPPPSQGAAAGAMRAGGIGGGEGVELLSDITASDMDAAMMSCGPHSNFILGSGSNNQRGSAHYYHAPACGRSRGDGLSAAAVGHGSDALGGAGAQLAVGASSGTTSDLPGHGDTALTVPLVPSPIVVPSSTSTVATPSPLRSGVNTEPSLFVHVAGDGVASGQPQQPVGAAVSLTSPVGASASQQPWLGVYVAFSTPLPTTLLKAMISQV